jgi:hypothetical protein
MSEKMREKILENLAAGSALGFLTLLIAVFSIVVDSRSVAAEKDALAGSAASVVAFGRVDDPDFDRVYAIRESAGSSYGVVLSERSSGASALFGAIFSPKGELRELRLLGSCSSRLPTDAKDALASFMGSEDALARAANAATAAAEADS